MGTARIAGLEKREACQLPGRTGNRNVSQMHLARQGVITEEMEYIAKRVEYWKRN